MSRKFWLWLFSVAALLFIGWGGIGVTQAAPGLTNTTISGVVYRDFNANGGRDYATGDINTSPQFPEPGVGGVTVTAYPASASGTSSAVSTTTANDGSFSLNVSAGEWRLEVTNLPSYLFDGAAGTTTVVFANVGDYVEIGVNNPAQYSQTDPAIATMLMSQGSVYGPYKDNAGLISMRRSVVGADAHAGTVTGDPYAPPDYTTLSTFGQVGATYGLAWDRTHGYLYSSAFHKYLVGYGPGGRGQIYRTPVDPSTGQATGSPQQWVNVESDLGFSLCGGHGGDIDSPPSSYEQTYFDQVGRCGLGDIDISWDDSALYAVLIDDNKVISIDTTSGALSGQWAIPAPADANRCSGTIYPFGMATKDDKVYVGQTCDNEAMIYVQELTPAGGTWRTVLAFNPTQDPNGNEAVDPSGMNPWITDIGQANLANDYREARQLIVGDLVFFGEDITIGIRDRMGDQWGHQTPDPNGDSDGDGLTNTQPFGNIWCAFYDATSGSYVYPRREGGSDKNTPQTCGPNRVTTSPNPSPEWFGGEFYWGDGRNDYYGGNIHAEPTSGAMAQWLLADVAVSSKTAQNSIGYSDIDSGGIHWLNNVDGAPTHAFEIYKSDVGQFGKANGLGDLEALSYPAPLEIGNRLWCDIGAGGVGAENGVQDPGEPVISGATVTLECDTDSNGSYDVTAITTTDGNGNYLFRDGDASLSNFPVASWDNTIHIIPRNAQCRIKIDPTQSAIANSCGAGSYAATIKDNGGSDAGADLRDSDGQDNVDGAGNVGTVFTTGGSGQNNHALDFGFRQAPKASLGDFVWHDLDHGQSHLVDGVQDAGEPGIEGVVVELYDDGGTLVTTTTTDANGHYQFDNLTPGDYTVKIADSNFQANGALDETDSAVDWHASPQDAAGDDTIDSDGDESSYEVAVSLGPGENDLDTDFGFFKSCVKFTKTGPDFINPGETFNFHFRVENCGDVVLHGGVSVYDALLNPDGDHEIWNDVVYPGEVKEFDEAYTPDESECPSIVNDATAEGHPQHPDGSGLANVTAEDSWTVTCASFSLGDYVWQDDDADGVQDAGESGINGVTVDLYSGTCDSLTASSSPLQTTTTASHNGADGWYEFTGLGSGDYCVALNRDNYAPGGPLTGLIASPPNASGDPATDSNASTSLKADVSLSADDDTIDFGLYPAPPVESGQCYVIADSGDYLGRIDHTTGQVQVLGKVDPPDGENLAIRPSDLTLFNVAGENTATPLITIDDQTAATTTINGDIGLDDVDALTYDPATQTMYAVKVDPNPGVLYTIDPATGATTHVVDLQTPSPDPLAGKTDPHIDGIAIDPNTGVMYGVYSAWASKSYLVTIDKTTGQLTFVGGPAGDEGYTGVDDIEDLSFHPDGTLYASLGDQGALGDDPSGSFEGLVILDTQTASATAVGQYGEPLQGMGEWDMEALACAIPPTSASIGDFVWEDANANGMQDAGESGIDGVTVELFKSDGTSMGTTTTANGGQYSFDNLAPGDYYVQFTLPNGYAFSPQDQGGDDTKDSDADTTTGKTATTTLSAGEHDPTWDAGMYRKASLGDYVWWDLDNDGVQDANESGLEGVTVTLKDASGNTVATTTTDANGAYSFTDLTPGDYTVVFTLPGSDWSFSPQDQGGDDALDSDADPNTGEADVTLSSGENDPTIDAGMTIPSSYVITKENTTAETDVAPGDPISFTITIENTGSTWLTVVPLRDEYDANYLTYVDANPASDDNVDDGVIDWSDLTVSFGQDLAPGESFTVVVNFTAKETTENLPNHETINTATAHDVMADPDGANGPIAAAGLPDQSDDAPANILNPVGEDMAGFSARAAGNAVRLHWQTASELDILGFNVLRRVGDGHWEQINDLPLFARHAGADMGGQYSFQDRGAPGERVIYALEIIHLDGSVERYGQVMIQINEVN